jgi:hypothetical protein
MKRLRSKLTYSNVMVTILAIIVLGSGTAYAASQLEKESVGTSQLKKGAVTPSKLSKASKKTLTGPAGPKGATGATGAAGPQGVKGETGAPATKLWAYVTASGTLLRSSGAVSAERTGAGFVHVNWNRDVSSCISIAVTGLDSFLAPPPGYATTDRNPSEPNTTFIQTYNKEGLSAALDTQVAVFC